MSNTLLTTADIESPVEPSKRKTMHKRWLLMVVLPGVVLAGAALAYLLGGRFVETENAYIQGEKVPLSSEVSGRVVEVLVSENKAVAAGELLFKLDPEPFDVALQKAQAKLDQVHTQLASLKASYAEKQAEIAAAQTQLNFAESNFKRQQDLARTRLVSDSTLDDAREKAELAAQKIATLNRELEQIVASLGGSVGAPLEVHPTYQVALAELQQARLDRQHAEIHAERAGVISKLPKAGQFLNAGSIASILLVTQHRWIEANFTETDLTYVRPGQAVTISVDAFPQHNWKGVVESLSPATGAEYSLIPAQNATGNWVKIAQRVAVRIAFVDEQENTQLRAGLSAEVTIDTGHQRQILGVAL